MHGASQRHYELPWLVVADEQGEWEAELEAAGFRGDRLSVWGLQVTAMVVRRRTFMSDETHIEHSLWLDVESDGS